MKLLIKNGRVIDPATKLDAIKDILVLNEKIVEVQDEINQEADEIIDAKGYWVVPGLIDVHVHLREPGFEHKETIETGSKSAAMGGFTTICCMPNTQPVVDSVEIVQYIKEKTKRQAVVNVLPIGSITKGQMGKELVDVEKLVESGICGISEDGKTVMDSALLKKAMEQAKAANIPVFSHCEDHTLVQGGAMNAGKKAEALGIKGLGRDAEEVIIARDIILARNTGVKLHLCHVSTKGGVELTREAKQRGENVTAEVCPHHFALTEDIVEKDFTNSKMNPPLRTGEDVDAIKQGLVDGTIEVIATDHAPHHADEKNQEFHQAPFGIVGLETALSIGMTELVATKLLTPMSFIEKMTINPAKLLGIDKGTIQVGKIADITILDSNLEYEIDVNTFASKSNNSPFHGSKVKGKVMFTIVAGEIIVENGELKH
ncbi:dihydroorotase, multifunctional complex type [Alkaliphilus metalliredigens QYMF]|uniref:Dihydroorotase n=1 Tax=Alkaliphilus metalliredigens (strain QYMF) TaxID=293826 RepID=A6TVS5_ALKMQ|nr:dihydroorotase [Alkaliphilus metalliredigens]ABR50293.1 dihydroorotase, multifunctional complex type [Alkaliphilus metalliredigens QYMF]